MAERKTFYKYRSLADIEQIERFWDIIINKQLYCPTYLQLDDAMEGRFSCPVGTDKFLLEHIKGMKQEYHICSLSKTDKASPLWAIYADECRGCCIEVEIDDSKGWKKYPVDYRPNMLRYEDFSQDIEASVVKLITTKSMEWKHQKEIRFVKALPYDEEKPFLKLKSIKAVTFGLRVSPIMYTFFKQRINSIDNTIVVRQLKWEDAGLGYKE